MTDIKWNYDMSAAPIDDEDDVLLLFDSATVAVIRNAFWHDDNDDPFGPQGWYSPRHSVTTELLYSPTDLVSGMFRDQPPVAWCVVPSYETTDFGNILIPVVNCDHPPNLCIPVRATAVFKGERDLLMRQCLRCTFTTLEQDDE